MTRKKIWEIHNELLRAFSVFDRWPSNFHRFLDQVSSHSKSLKTTTGLNSNFGGVYRHLHVPGKLSPSLSQVLRSEFEKYVSESWDDGYLAKSKWFQSNNGKYVSRMKACQRLNSHPGTIERLISNGMLKGRVKQNGRRRLFLVEAESVEQLKREPKLPVTLGRKLGSKLGPSPWFSMDEVAKLLGISRLSVVRLVKGSLLVSKHSPSADRVKAAWKFDRELVQNFLAGVLSTTKSYGKRLPNTELQSFTIVSDVVGRRLSGYGFHTLVGDILNGLLVPRAEAAGKPGLSRLQFSRKEVHQYLNNRSDHRNESQESPWIVVGAKRLGIRADVVQFLASKGLIETGARTYQQTSTTITREGILSFESTHLFAFDLASALGTTTRLLIRALRSIDVHPISGKLIDDGPQYVFRKPDLDAVEWSQLIRLSRQEKD